MTGQFDDVAEFHQMCELLRANDWQAAAQHLNALTKSDLIVVLMGIGMAVVDAERKEAGLPSLSWDVE